jgi:hypothetical protein
MADVHQQIGSSHGVKTTRCGLEGKDVRASGWQSDVTCADCLAGKKAT